MVWIGVDPGEKRIGVARSDPMGMLATPVDILSSEAELVGFVREQQADRPVEGVIIGLPRNMDGSIGPIARRSLRLVARLRAQLDCVMYLFDERLSTQQASRQGGAGKAGIDSRAAAVVLQCFLDSGCRPVPDPPEMAEEEGSARAGDAPVEPKS